MDTPFDAVEDKRSGPNTAEKREITLTPKTARQTAPRFDRAVTRQNLFIFLFVHPVSDFELGRLV
ncbi:MAG: hypothetical protein MR720_06665 [Sutterella sp.]|nr:hypothetical protein [Sutterella sp.]